MRILICLLFSIVALDFAAAACKINLKIKNETEHAIKLKYYGFEYAKAFQVKTRGVPWRSVERGGWDFSSGTTREIIHGGRLDPRYHAVLESGKTTTDIYQAGLGCGVKRKYRIGFECYEVEEHPRDPKYRKFTGASLSGRGAQF